MRSGPPPPGGGFNGPPQHRDNRGYGPPIRGDPRFGRYDGAGRGRSRDGGSSSYDDQRGYRGSYRGGAGGFRGRDRGYQDDRGDRDYFRDRDSGYRSPPPRSRRSRSRSPPGRYGGGGRRDVKPYSPPHRPTMGPSTPAAAPSSRSTDEFGRQIRPQSPDEGPSPTKEDQAQAQTVPASVSVVEKSVPTAAGSQIPSVTEQSTQPATTAENTNTSSTAIAATETEKSAGLDKFDVSTFNFTDPTSWEVLGKMWEVTYGWAPSTEQLMQFVMSGGVVASAAAAGLVPGSQSLYQQVGTGMGMGNMNMGGMNMAAGTQQNWGYCDQQQWGVGGQGRGGHAVRGVRHGQSHIGGYNSTSDAIVLGGGGDDSEDQMAVDQTSPPSGEGGGPGGRMQRVGDKWKFVRDGNGPS